LFSALLFHCWAMIAFYRGYGCHIDASSSSTSFIDALMPPSLFIASPTALVITSLYYSPPSLISLTAATTPPILLLAGFSSLPCAEAQEGD